MTNLVSKVLERGGRIAPLVIPAEQTNGTGIFNPSIYNDDGKLYVNIRHCQVTIWHSDRNKFEHQWGPLVYLNPENDITLTTTNYFCELNDDLTIKSYHKVNFDELNTKPIWEFIGLEDCRVFRWDGDLYLCGVRRDTTPNGQGRMEMSKIQINPEAEPDKVVKEVSRFRIPAPGKNDSYCEKNWMPVLDLPYHFVKWCNPTEVVKVDPIEKTCETVHLGNMAPAQFDYRGGSQVITIGDYRVAVTHQTYLFKSEQGRKDAVYRHCFVVWDKDWNIIKYGKPFAFLDNAIEFCAGMCLRDSNVIITFGVQDNSAYALEMPLAVFEDLVNE